MLTFVHAFTCTGKPRGTVVYSGDGIDDLKEFIYSSQSYKHTHTHACAGEPRETAVYSGDGIDDLKEFITAEKLPLTIEFTQQNTEKIFSSGISKQVRLCGL